MKSFPSILTLACLVATIGCETVPQQTPQTVSISCKVPTIATMPETKEAQEKGGLEITIVPTIYKAVRQERMTTIQTQPPFATLVLSSSEQRNQQVYVQETTESYLECAPKRLQFTVRVNNKLSRVFRGQGSVVQFNVGGKMIPFNNTDYKDFLNGIVPPRNEAELTIYGPPFDLIPEKGTIGLFLYDVVTATDTAGNVTDKQNYEWYFSYDLKPVEERGEVHVKTGFLDAASYQRRMVIERRAANSNQ